MQIKRHWLLVETMPFEYFFSGVGVYASGGAAITNKRSAGVYADRGALMTDRPRAVLRGYCPRYPKIPGDREEKPQETARGPEERSPSICSVIPGLTGNLISSRAALLLHKADGEAAAGCHRDRDDV